VRHNRIEVLKEMLKSDAKLIDRLHSKGYNPILDAFVKDMTDIGLILLEKCSESVMNEKDDMGWSPLMHAIANDNETLACKLIEMNCMLDQADDEGNTALHLAAINMNESILNRLLNANANKDLRNNEGSTALEIAIENSNSLENQSELFYF
jgi:uncharacterized protein